MTEELIRRLMAAGLTRQQATCTTAETLVNLFMPDDGKALIKEAQLQVQEMQQLLQKLKNEYDVLVSKITDVSATVEAIKKAQEEYGTLTDEKSRNAVALYGALLSMNKKSGANGNDAVMNASYVMYAYLGGQAKREVTYSDDKGRKQKQGSISERF